MRRCLFKAVSLLVLSVILLSFTGCKEKDPIIGRWVASISHEALNPDDTAAKIGVWNYISFDNVYKKQTYEFTEDGYYTLVSDNEQYIADYTKAIDTGLRLYYETIIKDNNLKITVEEAMAIDEVTVDDLIDKKSVEALKENTKIEGKYKTEEGKLYISSDREKEVNPDYYIEYEITENGNIRFIKQQGEGAESFSYYPLELKPEEEAK